jgi:hypothetical protein
MVRSFPGDKPCVSNSQTGGVQKTEQYTNPSGHQGFVQFYEDRYNTHLSHITLGVPLLLSDTDACRLHSDVRLGWRSAHLHVGHWARQRVYPQGVAPILNLDLWNVVPEGFSRVQYGIRNMNCSKAPLYNCITFMAQNARTPSAGRSITLLI